SDAGPPGGHHQAGRRARRPSGAAQGNLQQRQQRPLPGHCRPRAARARRRKRLDAPLHPPPSAAAAHLLTNVPKIRLLLLLVVAATAAAVLPATASAAEVAIPASCSPGACGAWVNSPVTVTWNFPAAPDAGSVNGCETGPFSQPGATVTCEATFNGGVDHGTGSVTVRVDQTAPGLSGAIGPDRPPDFNGWYNHAVTYGFPWADPLSGLAAGCQTGVT